MNTPEFARFLSQLAAGIDPRLAASDPAAAVQLAAALYSAAQEFPISDADLSAVESERIMAMAAVVDATIAKWFPPGEWISISEAFKRRPRPPKGDLKKEASFAKALREEGLTHSERITTNFDAVEAEYVALARNSALLNAGKNQEELEFVPHVEPISKLVEWTSMRAVDELFKRRRKHIQELDSARKKDLALPSQEQSSGEMPRDNSIKNRTKSRSMRNTKVKMRKSTEPKRKSSR